MIKECRQPPSLRKGDTIGIFCPAGPAKNAELVQRGIQLLQNAGFLVQCEGRIFPLNSSHSGYLSDSDANRAAALHRLWANEKVKAILAVRGGYGCLRILPLLDRKLLTGQAKWLAGFSDVTILLNFLSCHCGIASLHGPVLSSFMRGDQEDRELLLQAFSGQFQEEITLSQLEILQGGSAKGRLIGGNLASLVHLLGTPWDVPWDNCILLLEDTGEYMYRIDRMLTQLKLAGRLDGLAGILVGTFDTGGDNTLANLRLTEETWQRLQELVPAEIPVWAGIPVGHQGKNITLPLGMMVEMNATSGRLHLLPASLSRQ